MALRTLGFGAGGRDFLCGCLGWDFGKCARFVALPIVDAEQPKEAEQQQEVEDAVGQNDTNVAETIGGVEEQRLRAEAREETGTFSVLTVRARAVSIGLIVALADWRFLQRG